MRLHKNQQWCRQAGRAKATGTPSWAAALLLFASATACGTQAGSAMEKTPPNIVLITIDTLRADHMGCYGYFRQTTPHIDSLAQESILFENCSVPMATTLPSHVSMLTGTWPLEHGVLANVTHGGKAYKPAPGLVSLPQALGKLGFATAAFTSAKPLRLNSGIAAGFAHFDECQSNARRAEVTTGLALNWLREHLSRNPEQPFFLWVHLFDPHSPYDTPAPYAGTFTTDEQLQQFMDERVISLSSWRPGGQEVLALPSHNAYDAEILYSDAQVGKILEALEQQGLSQETLVMLLTDHGEGLGQHAEPGHGLVWQEQVRAAWMMRVPGLAARRVSERVSSVDMLPTLLVQLGLDELREFSAQCSGVDVLADGFLGRSQFSQSSARLIQYGKPVMHSISKGRWKMIWGAERPLELYDLEDDPHELEDIAEREPQVLNALREELLQHLERLARRAGQLGDGEEIQLDPATIKALGELGYTGIDDK